MQNHFQGTATGINSLNEGGRRCTKVCAKKNTHGGVKRSQNVDWKGMTGFERH